MFKGLGDMDLSKMMEAAQQMQGKMARCKRGWLA